MFNDSKTPFFDEEKEITISLLCHSFLSRVFPYSSALGPSNSLLFLGLSTGFYCAGLLDPLLLLGAGFVLCFLFLARAGLSVPKEWCKSVTVPTPISPLT